MEEFRSPIADSICCYLFNDNILNPDNFENANNGIYLTNPGMKKVVAAFEEKMSQSISYANKTLSYRQIIFYQIENYKKFIMKEVDSYIPFKYR